MAKGQSQRPGRDVTGGSGKRQRPYNDKGGYQGKGGGGKGGYQGKSGGGYRGKGADGGSWQGKDSGAKGGSGQGNRSYQGKSGGGKGSYQGKSAGGRGSYQGKGGYQGRGGDRSSGRYGNNRGQGGRPQQRRDFSVIEGRRAAAEALDVHVPIKRALVANAGGDRSLDQLIGRLEAEGVAIEYVGRDRLDARSAHGAHQGIMLETEPYKYAELTDVLEAAGDDDALVILLDHVTDEGNFGAIVRTAEVVGAVGIIVANARAARVSTAVYKTSAGAILHMPIVQVANLAGAIDTLKEEGFWVGAATEHAESDVWSAPLDGRLCLVMGSEGSGVSQLVRKKCDFEFKLPQRGRVESLNVAQATTAICYEWLRREMGKGADAE